ncbi:MAG: dihydroxyacetone kinase family protein, partial [Candidatus Nanopelagicales bacterium]|nr:dihydroxyacetone kinase family protein [Candidatus Nanopelagicales bacterium]
MTHLLNNPVDFPVELVDGFVKANSKYVKKVYGGVVRATKSKPGKVAIITGGGTGHYPGFMGWVGPGLVDGAVTGNIFASPSASQVRSVAKAADHGGGILLAFLNYAGDVLHFGMAEELLKADGFDVRRSVVTDDVASAPVSETYKRRGIAGGLAVLKVASAAAESGLSLDEVLKVLNKTNERTRTFGVAFSGCTLPGSANPLFEVPAGKMAVGLGVHGEPGIYELDLGTADDVAKLLVDKLLEDVPQNPGKKVIALLNGLGSAKYEELFVTFSCVANRLKNAGIQMVDGEVGEFMTSLDMGGLSLTLVWVDDEIEKYWLVPCDSPAFRKTKMIDEPLDSSIVFNTEPEALKVTKKGNESSRNAAAQIAKALEKIKDIISENESMLGDLDAVAGDGDHGAGMTRGSKAAAEAANWLVKEGAGAQTTLAGAGARWSENAGGASGALWGAALIAAGNALGDDKDLDLKTYT